MRAARCLLLLLLLPALGLAAGKSIANQTPSVDMLDWLAGRWRVEQAGRVTEAQWTTSAGGVLFGMARTIFRGRLIEYEFDQIREGPGGDLFYITQRSGQAEAAYKQLSLTDTEVVFENKEHEFPQTIGYRLNSDGSVLAYIEGPGPDGGTKRIEYAYQRMKE